MFPNESTVQFVDKLVSKYQLNQSKHSNNYSKKPYIVISALCASELENKVAVAIQQGYYAQGGLSVSESEGVYYQAMILVQ